MGIFFNGRPLRQNSFWLPEVAADDNFDNIVITITVTMLYYYYY
jgi:hypothetical protein